MTIEIYGTEYRLTFSFFAVVTAMLLTCDPRIVAVSTVSSLLHEFGHLVFMYLYKEPPERVIFGLFGIRIERRGISSLNNTRLAAVAIGGVLVNGILAAVFFVLYRVFGYTVFAVGAAVNFLIGGLNMMPVGILDAGQFLRYILLERFDEDKTENMLTIISDFAVLFFAFFCVGYTVLVKLNASLICVSLYLMVINLNRLPTKRKDKGRHKQTGIEHNMVLSDKFLPNLRQKCSKCVSISPLSFLSRLKFIR